MKSFNGENYRDDRMYVMRITSNYLKDQDGAVTASMKIIPETDLNKPVVIITYRNLQNLPAVRFDEFSTLKAAYEYAMEIEPTCPRISLSGRPPQPVPSWSDHIAWLHGQGLISVTEGDAPIPNWVGSEDQNPRETFMSRQT